MLGELASLLVLVACETLGIRQKCLLLRRRELNCCTDGCSEEKESTGSTLYTGMLLLREFRHRTLRHLRPGSSLVTSQEFIQNNRSLVRRVLFLPTQRGVCL